MLISSFTDWISKHHLNKIEYSLSHKLTLLRGRQRRNKTTIMGYKSNLLQVLLHNLFCLNIFPNIHMLLIHDTLTHYKLIVMPHNYLIWVKIKSTTCYLESTFLYKFLVRKEVVSYNAMLARPVRIGLASNIISFCNNFILHRLFLLDNFFDIHGVNRGNDTPFTLQRSCLAGHYPTVDVGMLYMC